MERKKVLVTGANGFLGKKLCEELKNKNIPFKSIYGASSKKETSCDFSKNFDLTSYLKETHTVVHCAGRAHIFKKDSANKNLFYKINQEAIEKLAKQCIESGVKKFILISTAGVMGRISIFPNKLSVINKPKPFDDYTLSKLEGENALVSSCKNNEMKYTILRPPLIYGPNAPGNWKRLNKLLSYKIPLPFKNIKNKRSFVFLDNLIDLIITCIFDQKANNQIFNVSDNEDISTSELINFLLEASNLPNKMFAINKNVLIFIASLIGRKSTMQQLICNLQLDVNPTMIQLDWKPKYSVEEAINLSVKKFPMNHD